MVYFRIILFILVSLTASWIANTSAAGLENTVIQSGPNSGKKLVDVIRAYRVDGLAIPERAITDSIRFFDAYRDTRHTVHFFAHIPKGDSEAWGAEATEKDRKTIANQRYLVIFDLDQHSSKRSLHLIDLETGEIESTEAARGKDSVVGPGSPANKDPACANKTAGYACHFESHTNDSSATPLGFFSTGKLYRSFNRAGIKDLKIQMFGLEKPTLGGFEGNDIATTVVIHKAWHLVRPSRGLDGKPDCPMGWHGNQCLASYVSAGNAGRSEGCPALSPEVFERWKDKLKDGALFYFYSHQLDSMKREGDLSGIESSAPAVGVTERISKPGASPLSGSPASARTDSVSNAE